MSIFNWMSSFLEKTEKNTYIHVSFSAVVILCFFCTITTNFEYELKCSKVGYDFVKGERCIFKSSNENALCDTDVFDAICKPMKFEGSSGKPCLSNQTSRAGQCEEVSLQNKYHLFQVVNAIAMFSFRIIRFIRTAYGNRISAGLIATRISFTTHQHFSALYYRSYCSAF